MSIFGFDIDGNDRFEALDMEIMEGFSDMDKEELQDLIERAEAIGLEISDFDDADELMEAVESAEEEALE